jgi:hypothetical protein
MTRAGMVAAIDHGSQLPSFESQSHAERTLFAQRDASLRDLLDEVGPEVLLDGSPESLTRLERWYFENEEPTRTKSGTSVASGIGFYLGRVLCVNANFAWIVQEYVFMPGRYEIGVSRGGLSIMLSRGRSPHRDGNVQMKSLLREYRKYVP